MEANLSIITNLYKSVLTMPDIAQKHAETKN